MVSFSKWGTSRLVMMSVLVGKVGEVDSGIVFLIFLLFSCSVLLLLFVSIGG